MCPILTMQSLQYCVCLGVLLPLIAGVKFCQLNICLRYIATEFNHRRANNKSGFGAVMSSMSGKSLLQALIYLVYNN